jgi:uncharacterized protein
MRFKYLLFILFPLALSAFPGYELPWGKDAALLEPRKEKEIQSQTFAVAIAKQIIVFHQKVLSPVDGPRSHFYPCSSQYMKLAMMKHGFMQGFFMGCDRLLRENKDPWIYRNIVINGELVKYDPPK